VSAGHMQVDLNERTLSANIVSDRVRVVQIYLPLFL